MPAAPQTVAGRRLVAEAEHWSARDIAYMRWLLAECLEGRPQVVESFAAWERETGDRGARRRRLSRLAGVRTGGLEWR